MLEQPGSVLVPVAASFHPVVLRKSTRIILSPCSDLWDGKSRARGSSVTHRRRRRLFRPT